MSAIPPILSSVVAASKILFCQANKPKPKYTQITLNIVTTCLILSITILLLKQLRIIETWPSEDLRKCAVISVVKPVVRGDSWIGLFCTAHP